MHYEVSGYHLIMPADDFAVLLDARMSRIATSQSRFRGNYKLEFNKYFNLGRNSQKSRGKVWFVNDKKSLVMVDVGAFISNLQKLRDLDDGDGDSPRVEVVGEDKIEEVTEAEDVEEFYVDIKQKGNPIYTITLEGVVRRSGSIRGSLVSESECSIVGSEIKQTKFTFFTSLVTAGNWLVVAGITKSGKKFSSLLVLIAKKALKYQSHLKFEIQKGRFL